MRTIIDIPDIAIGDLAALAERLNQPRAALVREAIAEYLTRHRVSDVDAFGLWGAEAVDGLAYQEKVRAEWLLDGSDGPRVRRPCTADAQIPGRVYPDQP